MHTRLCRHATGDATDYAAQAVRVGLTEIGFSEHNPMVRDDFDNWRMFDRDLDVYVEQVQKARRDHPTLQIRLGLEIDFIPGLEDWIQALAGRHAWDYLIGSVHYISGGWALDNPEELAKWKERDPFEVWTAYFERLTEAVESGLFDIVGHADLCKKFGFYPDRDCTALYTRFLHAAKKQGMAMELNTAGLRKDCKEIYPNRAIVQMAAQLGVPITFGSDAHAPGEVGMNFAEAVQLARESGYSQCCRFAQRTRDLVPF